MMPRMMLFCAVFTLLLANGPAFAGDDIAYSSAATGSLAIPADPASDPIDALDVTKGFQVPPGKSVFFKPQLAAPPAKGWRTEPVPPPPAAPAEAQPMEAQ